MTSHAVKILRLHLSKIRDGYIECYDIFYRFSLLNCSTEIDHMSCLVSEKKWSVTDWSKMSSIQNFSLVNTPVPGPRFIIRYPQFITQERGGLCAVAVRVLAFNL